MDGLQILQPLLLPHDHHRPQRRQLLVGHARPPPPVPHQLSHVCVWVCVCGVTSVFLMCYVIMVWVCWGVVYTRICVYICWHDLKLPPPVPHQLGCGVCWEGGRCVGVFRFELCAFVWCPITLPFSHGTINQHPSSPPPPNIYIHIYIYYIDLHTQLLPH